MLNAEQWKEIERLYHASIELEPARRAQFLANACPHDEIRRKVELLLAHREAPASFIDRPGLEVAAEMMTHNESNTLVGHTIGQYQVLGLIGAGGMGLVYRARDTKLGRDVALKVLPDELAQDQERLIRSEREARLLASLNHPNIAAIYDLKESDGIRCLVLEYIEGETLAARLKRGPLPMNETLNIGRYVADALEAAHEQGIVHRDVKPGNVMITTKGVVKVLDFGIAKILEASSSPELHNTLSTGVVLGTPAYMSPEQARGGTVDKRTDIWAFGCVLYEALTGRPVFAGETVSDTIAMILDREPPWNALPKETPPGLGRLLRRCLEKDPKRRLHDIADVRIELDDALPGKVDGRPSMPIIADTSVAGVKRGELFRWGLAAAFAITLGVVGFLAAGYLHPPRTDARAMRFFVALPDGVNLAPAYLTVGAPAPLSVSPDGQAIAFTARNADGKTTVWVRSLDSLTARTLQGTEDASSPFWSPDGRFLGFFAGGKLKKIDMSGGPAITLCDAADNRGGAWGLDGTIIFAPSASIAAPLSTGLLKVPASGGAPAAATVLAEGETSHVSPTFLPDGRHFLYRALKSGESAAGPIYLASLDSVNRTFLLNATSTNVAFSQSHLLFVRESTLMAQPFDPGRAALTGEAVAIAGGIQTRGNPPLGVFSASNNGVLAYQMANALSTSQLTWLDRAGTPIGTVGDLAGYDNPELSADGKRAGVELVDPDVGTRDIWLFDLARSVRTRFTFDRREDTTPVWSPDGSRIVFDSARGGALELYQKETSGSVAEQILLSDGRNKFPSSWSPDGQFILYMVDNGTTNWDLWVLPLSGDRKPFPFVQTPFNDIQGRFSPDGRWVVYVSNESGREEVYVAPFPNPHEKWQISSAGGWWPRWRADGKEIFYLALDNKLMAASVNDHGTSFETLAVRTLFQTRPVIRGTWPYDVSPDGRFLVNTIVEAPTLSTAERRTAPITLVVNWGALSNK